MKHTPGPWRTEPDVEGNNTCVYAAPNRLICIAGVRSGLGGTPENEANARIAAAAPTMLELLASILKEGEVSATNEVAITELLKSLE